MTAREQGSPKTVLAKMLGALVDPNVAPVRALPREERDLFIAGPARHDSTREAGVLGGVE